CAWCAIAGRKPPDAVMDFRQPQDGVSTRTLRSRHKKKSKRTSAVESVVHNKADRLPSAEPGPEDAIVSADEFYSQVDAHLAGDDAE
ncbi:MAG: hypothetical protein ACP5MD_10210, partial [Verrucomicrobiia bacterium]